MQRGGGGRLGRGESVVTRKQLQTHVSDARVPFDAPPRSVLATLRLSILISRHASSLSKSAEGFQTSLGFFLFGVQTFKVDFERYFFVIFFVLVLESDFLFCFVRVLVKVKSRY
ncbi:hypothetical protein CK203_085442 [Vitis vinifera]|uniref:Uncharacterized protein n=1 Tax=Vitis vinifera TaxID=29760 RepID=A0A438BUH9_VITVI|nr:hypothetical protein CK203_085442 [Vitis vinifera]